MKSQSEKRLIKKIKKDDDAAFKQLYELYVDYALRSCYYITQNTTHTADIVQETFIKVYRGLHTFDHKRPFKPWFYQILLNESKRYMKKQNKQAVPIESEEIIDYLDEKETISDDASYIAEDLNKMSEAHRTVLTLKYLNGFSEIEIAQMLHLNVNTVKSRLFKARAKMRKSIGGGNDD